MISPYTVYFTSRSYLQVVQEVSRYPGVETGGVFLGRRIGNDFYVFESVDAGRNAVRAPGSLKLEFEYIEHLGDVYKDIYKDLGVLGMWHRHPGDFDVFSSADHLSNADYANMFNGAISGLVNIDPDYRLQLFYVSPPDGRPTLCNPAVIDDSVFESIVSLKDYNAVIDSINEQERTLPLPSQEEFGEERPSRGYSTKKTVNKFIKKLVNSFYPDQAAGESEDTEQTISWKVYQLIQNDLATISKSTTVTLDDCDDGTCLVAIVDPISQRKVSFIFSFNTEDTLSLYYIRMRIRLLLICISLSFQ